jgi:hypothetical protein
MKHTFFALSFFATALFLTNCTNNVPVKKDYAKEVDEVNAKGVEGSDQVVAAEEIAEAPATESTEETTEA